MTEALIWDIVRWVIFVAIGIFLCVLIFRVLTFFLAEMGPSKTNRSGPGVWLETNWGGLGGGLSGWRVSNAVVYLLVITFLLGCLMLAAATILPDKKPSVTNGTDNGGSQGQKPGGSKGGEQNPGQEKDPGKGSAKSDAAGDGDQKKEGDDKKDDKKKDDPCAKTPVKPTKTNPKTKPGCSVPQSATPTPTPTPSTEQ